MRRKAQAILPFFAVQLVCMMIFIIVLLSLLTMTKNVKFTINEFDENTAFLLSGRRLLSSADCFAYEERSLFYDSKTQELYSGTRILPNVLDYNKLRDYENFNCMRNDDYDKVEDVIAGYWDAANATGAAFSYRIKIVDLKTGGYVYDSVISNNFSTSLIGRIDKTEDFSKSTWSGGTDKCGTRFGANWYVSGNAVFGYFCVDDSFKSCAEGRCIIADGKETANVTPYWNIQSDPLALTTYSYVFNDTDVPNYADDNTGLTMYLDVSTSPNDIDPIWQSKNWTQWDTTCASVNGSRSMIIPTMLMINKELHPAVMYLQTCLIKGEEFKGTTLLEIAYTPPQKVEGCP